MKKVVRMLGLCALVALAFTACKKNETKNVTFKATITQPTSDSRTYLNSGYVLWYEGDNIHVFNQSGENIVCAASNLKDANYEASFEGDGAFLADLDVEAKYASFYPVADINAGNVTMTISDEQEYETTSFGDELYPMYAVNDANGNFAFTSDAGVLTIRVRKDAQSQQEFKVYKVRVTAPAGDNTVGSMVYAFNAPFDADPQYNVEDTHSVVVLKDCEKDGFLGTDIREYNIVLLEGALNGQFTIELLGENDALIATRTSNPSTTPTIEAMKRLVMPEIILGTPTPAK